MSTAQYNLTNKTDYLQRKMFLDPAGPVRHACGDAVYPACPRLRWRIAGLSDCRLLDRERVAADLLRAAR